jgi:hypothetical protein
MRIDKKIGLLLLAASCMMSGCAAFMYGYTNRQAMNKYYLTQGDSFGSKRLQYAEKFHNNTAFDAHIKKYGDPDFIYEYPVDKKHQGIKLFYLKQDSVYVFESKNSRCDCISLTQTALISPQEKSMYDQLSRNK